jgi:DSBA-like thioredoxin domain
MPSVDFYFDPACPWTWLTSRWLVDAAAQRDVDVTWRPLSLLALSGGTPHPDYAEQVLAARKVHRVVTAAQADGRNDLVGTLYTSVGELTFQVATSLTDTLARQAVERAGLQDWAKALDDEGWDSAVEQSTKEAVDLAGPDIGSPVLAWGEPRVGLFGPIVSPGPRGEAAARLLDLVLEAGAIDGFFELKRGRRAGPALPAPPTGATA